MNKYIYRWLCIVNDVFLKQYTHTYIYMCTCSVAKLWLIPCNPNDCNAPGSSVHEVFQARILDGCICIYTCTTVNWYKDFYFAKGFL